MTQPRKITQEIDLPLPVTLVWEFIADETNMKQWFQADIFVIDVYEGGQIEIPFSFAGEECVIVGEIGLFLPQKKFVFTWSERNPYGETWFNNTMITIELATSETGTHVTMTHDGFKYLSPDMQTAVFQKYQAYWQQRDILPRLYSLIVKM